ncbi:MAG: transporter substrate-binding domain-containing protein [Gemmatimonas sp.]
MRLWLSVIALWASLAAAAHADALAAARARGHLTCGIAGDQPGLSYVDSRGVVTGFEADVCRAVAAAIFGSADRIAFRRLATIRDFLAAPEVDLVVHGLTWTFAREARLDVRFGPITFYDGQAVLVPRRLEARSIADLAGRSLCVRQGGERVANLQRAVAAADVRALPDRSAAETAFFAGECDALSADATELAAALLVRPQHGADYVVLPERLSKEPLAPLLRRGDDDLLDVVRWTVFALIEAEELDVSRANVDERADDSEPRLRDLRASESPRLGLAPGWTVAVVRAVGNYGEIYARNVGSGTPAGMDRGLNALWRDGGLMYAPPIR